MLLLVVWAMTDDVSIAASAVNGARKDFEGMACASSVSGGAAPVTDHWQGLISPGWGLARGGNFLLSSRFLPVF
jgi:hypothetical protein